MSLVSISTSFGLGLIHALEPGHGKAFLASYITGSSVSKSSIWKMTLSMAISHSMLLVVLAFVFPFVLPQFEEEIHRFVLLGATLLILFVGFKMLYDAVWLSKIHNCNCEHHSHNSHKISVLVKKNHAARGNFSHLKLSAAVEPTLTANSQNSDKTVFVGFINGLLPCPSALAVIGISATNPNYLWASATLVVYVLGFSCCMCCWPLLSCFSKTNW